MVLLLHTYNLVIHSIPDAVSQVSALQMVAGKQVEVCVLESPVIRYHRKSLDGVYSLHMLSSLGPLPPYPIMVNKKMSRKNFFNIKILFFYFREKQNYF